MMELFVKARLYIDIELLVDGVPITLSKVFPLKRVTYNQLQAIMAIIGWHITSQSTSRLWRLPAVPVAGY